ncbi:hypothetical protein M2272_002580 [Mycobacterium frederiksbergense]|uniref:DUF4386 domain-containing protein n=1 Tax=Mycolicibacterium frederiksbergense TaxID=117567 RepID=A0ABT6L0Z5_9MYCO|nr:DUF4386 domain-containing protein [Mycolicibacterium frederiksbergense]MDH6195940.1 hypothetical protein [Mycolicibacterium frederiksbergense]
MSAPPTTPKALATIAGCLYLTSAVLTIFAGVVNARTVVSGNAAATTANIETSVTLFRIGFVSELVGATAFLATGMALYLLLKHVNQMAAAAMVTIVAVSVAVQSSSLLNQKAALMIATGHYGFSPTTSEQLAMLFVDLQHDGYLIAQTYFGLWLLPLGYLVVKSGYFPKAVGILLMIGCFGHLMDVFARSLTPNFGETASPFALGVAAVAELSFIVWLLVKGVEVPAS